MWAAILELLNGLLMAINKTFPSYLPPKSTEEKVQEGQAKIDQQISDEQNGGGPSK